MEPKTNVGKLKRIEELENEKRAESYLIRKKKEISVRRSYVITSIC